MKPSGHAMRHALFILLAGVASALAGEQWPQVAFNEARAYAWPNDFTTEAVILPGMRLKPGVINPDGAALSPEQIKRLAAATNGKHPEHAVAGCHIPHNAVVFYDAQKKPVAFLEICFTCLSYRGEPNGLAERVALLSIASIFAELKLPMGEYPDLAAFKRHWER
jgi:hypothetical protein